MATPAKKQSFLGGAAAYRAKALALLDLVTSRLNHAAQKIIDMIVTIMIIGVCGYLSFSPQIANMLSTGLDLQMTYVYLTIPIGFTLIILFGIEHLAQTLFFAPDESVGELKEKEG